MPMFGGDEEEDEGEDETLLLEAEFDVEGAVVEDAAVPFPESLPRSILQCGQ